MMAGTTERYNRIAGHLYASLLAAEDGGCKTYFADMKLQTPNDVGYYPDVLIVCEERIITLLSNANPVESSKCYQIKLKQ
jgi:Uma2 family endonuclease